MVVLGCACVSTGRQSLDQQHDALTAAGAERISTDKRSGVRDDREGLAALFDYARAGDVVVVVAFSRLGRSLSGIVRTIETWTAAGVQLCSLRESIDTTTVVGRMLAGVVGWLAEYERSLIRGRSAVAWEAARDRGRPVGRPKVLTPDQEWRIRAVHAVGGSVSALVATFGVLRVTIYRLLVKELVLA